MKKSATELPPETRTALYGSAPKGLARILDLERDTVEVWQEDELPAIFRHQLSTTIKNELESFEAKRAARLLGAVKDSRLLGMTFGELFGRKPPPLEILALTKDIAKARLKNPPDKLLKNIATALYFASYAVAIVRTGKRLGTLSDLELRKGFDWAIGRSWIDNSTKGLFVKAREKLSC